MKRKLEEDFPSTGINQMECEFEVYIPPRRYKRISMCDNTPKQAKDEKKQIMNTSERKLKQLKNPEENLLRSLLVNNVHRTLEAELKQGKHEYYGYGFNPMCPVGYDKSPRDISDRKRQAKLEKILKQKSLPVKKLKKYHNGSENKTEQTFSSDMDNNVDIVKDVNDNHTTNSSHLFPSTVSSNSSDLDISTTYATLHGYYQSLVSSSSSSSHNNKEMLMSSLYLHLMSFPHYLSTSLQTGLQSNYSAMETVSNQTDSMSVDVEDDEIIDVCSMDDDDEVKKTHVSSSAQLLLLQRQEAFVQTSHIENNSFTTGQHCVQNNKAIVADKSMSIECSYSSTCDICHSSLPSSDSNCTRSRTSSGDGKDQEYQGQSSTVLKTCNKLTTDRTQPLSDNRSRVELDKCKYKDSDNPSEVNISHTAFKDDIDEAAAITKKSYHSNASVADSSSAVFSHSVLAASCSPSAARNSQQQAVSSLSSSNSNSKDCISSAANYEYSSATDSLYQGYIFPAALQQYYGYLPQFHQQHVQGIYH